jgi:hypothetical protein
MFSVIAEAEIFIAFSFCYTHKYAEIAWKATVIGKEYSCSIDGMVMHHF